MKSFADWTQELAESNNHEPEPDRVTGWDYAAEGTDSYTVDCEGERCTKCGGIGRVMVKVAEAHLRSEDCPACTPLTCSGPGCCKVGVPNYWAGDYQFYCGGSPRCCP